VDKALARVCHKPYRRRRLPSSALTAKATASMPQITATAVRPCVAARTVIKSEPSAAPIEKAMFAMKG